MIILTAVLMLTFSACTDRRSVNDADTGEVDPGTLKHSYADGTYTAYTPYHNDEGYAAFMRLTVTNGIISEVKFEMYDTDMEAYSARDGEEYESENEEFRSAVKNLNTHLMQDQSAEDLRSSYRFASYYIALAQTCTKLAAEGTEEAGEVILTEEYNVFLTPETESEEPLSYALTVRYSGERIIYISFRELSSEGRSLTGFPEEHMPPEEADITYREVLSFLNSVGAEMTELKKDSPWDCPLTEIDMYNVLADMIEEKHARFYR